MHITNILAEVASKAVEQTDKINEIHELMINMLGFRFMLGLTIITAVLCIVIFQRQKKIAQNQVDLAMVMEKLLEKK